MIAQVFYLCNVVPRVLRQHGIKYFLMQCCLEPQGQHCIDTRDTLDTLVICSCTMLSDSTSSKHCTGKNPVQCCLNTAGTTFTVKNPMQCCPWGSRQQCTGKNLFNVVLILLGQRLTGKTLCNVVPEASEKKSRYFCLDNIWPLHLVTLFICATSQKNVKISFL